MSGEQKADALKALEDAKVLVEFQEHCKTRPGNSDTYAVRSPSAPLTSTPRALVGSRYPGGAVAGGGMTRARVGRGQGPPLRHRGAVVGSSPGPQRGRCYVPPETGPSTGWATNGVAGIATARPSGDARTCRPATCCREALRGSPGLWVYVGPELADNLDGMAGRSEP
jgi:hypothetical protein